ncbi:MAG: carbamoyltransferase HypF [Deltaproteobacteria bacterium]|jgi:hydrogenase maturation protein HypF|nr:carbamoyltransferase HypF [Deltaproteobacteria bacterium]
MRRKGFSITGRVQGVGFRPFIFRLARRYGITGLVRNAPEGVRLEAQGQEDRLRAFGEALRVELPPLARVSSWTEHDLPPVGGETSFSIAASAAGVEIEVMPSPDMATCPNCLNDILDPAGRRFRHPFANCTDCGPRYSITAGLPYDRERTAMACFPLCEECAQEYADPENRRFHAQPNACLGCGPEVWLTGPQGGGAETSLYRNDAALRELARLLMTGHIAAIKGLGGFHLACDAFDERAIRRLRRRKRRPHKPLAIMLAGLEEAAGLVRLGEEASPERRLLISPERPIVLCPRTEGSPLPALLAPDTLYVGVMLPYTPLQHILLRDCAALRRDGRPTALVMTSGNMGDEPIALGNREALLRLGGMADYFLLHNRDILVRVDDSVLRPLPPEDGASSPVAGKGTAWGASAPEAIFLRRARGFVPSPLPLPATRLPVPNVLGLGAELKNAPCLNRGLEAFVGQHVGDLRHQAAGLFQEETVRHLTGILRVEPQARVIDAHPDFSPAAGTHLPLLRLPHHFAHALAVLAENGSFVPALVLTLDGAGFAPEEINPARTIWGGELLRVDFPRPGGVPAISRLGSLVPLPLPGGEAAVREPWRIAHALLLELGLRGAARKLPWLPAEEKTAALLPALLASGLNTPRSSGLGRLFDAVSALLGLCSRISYEGQAAIRLEEAQHHGQGAPHSYRELYAEHIQGSARALPCPLLEQPVPGGPGLVLDTPALFRAIYELARPPLSALAQTSLARAFHWSLAEALADMALRGSRLAGTTLVGLSGGVMQNMSMHLLLREKLRQRGLTPLTHRALPPGDGCIAYGQVAWAVSGGQCLEE